jgi:hypothetical protein
MVINVYTVKRSVLILAIAFALSACKKDSPIYEKEFRPTDVVVVTKSGFDLEQVFEFINSFDHEVEYIRSATFVSKLPSDSLSYVLKNLSAKPYLTNPTFSRVGGYLHYQTKEIYVFPVFFNIENKSSQQDWIETAKLFELEQREELDDNGFVILFHVPAGQEKSWVEKFSANDIVRVSELNYIADLHPAL